MLVVSKVWCRAYEITLSEIDYLSEVDYCLKSKDEEQIMTLSSLWKHTCNTYNPPPPPPLHKACRLDHSQSMQLPTSQTTEISPSHHRVMKFDNTYASLVPCIIATVCLFIMKIEPDRLLLSGCIRHDLGMYLSMKCINHNTAVICIGCC